MTAETLKKQKLDTSEATGDAKVPTKGFVFPEKYGRPEMAPVDNKTDITFYITDFIGDTRVDDHESYGILHIFGVTEKGNSVMLSIDDYYHYCYVEKPDGFEDQDCKELKNCLNLIMNGPLIRSVEVERKLEQQPQVQKTVLKISVATPQIIEQLKDECGSSHSLSFYLNPPSHIFKKGECEFAGFQGVTRATYGCDVDYLARFMKDIQFKGRMVPGTFILLPAQKFTVIDKAHQDSTCQLEVKASYMDIEFPEWQGRGKTAPLRLFTYDIETTLRPPPEIGQDIPFPHPGLNVEYDQVAQIGCTITLCQSGAPRSADPQLVRCIFTLKSCAAIDGCDVYSFDNEKDLLKAWREFVLYTDPDIITGYNIMVFDFPYLLVRGKMRDLSDFGQLGRLRKKRSVVQDYNKRDWSNAPVVHGRACFDGLHWARNKLHWVRSKKLENVAHLVLGAHKMPMTPEKMRELQAGDAQSRKKLAIYCMRDVDLPRQLSETQGYFETYYLANARKHHVPIDWIVSRSEIDLTTPQKIAGTQLVKDL